MTKPVSNRTIGRSIAAALVGAVLLSLGGVATAGPAWSQTAGRIKGVAPWQAERAIEEFNKNFTDIQIKHNLKKLPNNDSHVRIKIEALTRVENKEFGTMWVAQFSGAVLPNQFNTNAEQDYAHAILRVHMDKNNNVRVVVNEGQGLWRMHQKTSILYGDLPEKTGKWKAWGGTEDIPEPIERTFHAVPQLGQTYTEPPNEIAGGTVRPYSPPTVSTGKTAAPSDAEAKKWGEEVARTGRTLSDLKQQKASNAAIAAAQKAYEDAQRKYYEIINKRTQSQ